MSIPRTSNNYHRPKSTRSNVVLQASSVKSVSSRSKQDLPALNSSGKIPDKLLVEPKLTRFEYYAVLGVWVAAIIVLVSCAWMAYADHSKAIKRRQIVSKDFGQYQTSLYSLEARQRASEDARVLKEQYLASKTLDEKKKTLLELHKRLSTIPYGTLPEDLQQFAQSIY